MQPDGWLIAYLLGYVLLHSLLAAEPIKALFHDWSGGRSRYWYRLMYTLLATVLLLPLPWLLIYRPDRLLYQVPAPWWFFLVLGQSLAALGFLGAVRQTHLGGFLGFSQLRGQFSEEGLVTSGYYGAVRHPLYSLGLLMMWLSPIMTVNLLTAFSLISVYLLVGSLHEEHRLRREFGEAYAEYCRNTGRFIPRPRFLASIWKGGG